MALQFLHNRYLRVIERILSCSWLLTKLYVSIQDNMVINEFASIQIKDPNVLVIGCGSIPNTVITLARSMNWKITGIDKDKKAVEKARKIITKYGLRNVEIRYADAKDADLKGFDLIVVALGTEPKEKILERISRDAEKGAYIVCRTAGSFSLLLGREDLNIKNLEIVSRRFRKDGTESVVLLKR